MKERWKIIRRTIFGTEIDLCECFGSEAEFKAFVKKLCVETESHIVAWGASIPNYAVIESNWTDRSRVEQIVRMLRDMSDREKLTLLAKMDKKVFAKTSYGVEKILTLLKLIYTDKEGTFEVIKTIVRKQLR